MTYTLANIENPVAYEKAIKRNIVANAQKTFSKAYAKEHQDMMDFLSMGRTYDDFGGMSGYKEGFVGSLAEAYDTYGKLTSGQANAVLKNIEKNKARKAEWADKQASLNASRIHLGTVGEKLTVTLKVVHIIDIESNFGTIYINICEDADKNIIIYKGNAKGFPEKGETATIIATVKDHGVRDGVKQTVIQRPKLVSLTKT